MVQRSNQKTTIIIYNELSKHCTAGEDGAANYESGWDDERVYKMLEASSPDMGITLAQVTGIRRKMFGRITVDRKSGIEDRLKALEEFVMNMSLEMERISGGRYKAPSGRPRSTPPE
jgi:hypothetical protein